MNSNDFYRRYCPWQRSLYRQLPSPPSGFPFGPAAGASQPSGPPPSVKPKKLYSALKVDPGGLIPCKYKFTYVWLKKGKEAKVTDAFWTFIVHVGPTSVAGFRWTGSQWVFWGTDLKNIDTFTCY
ncbi:hypothetical protein [Thermotalea metallivorans]|uniref:hypothetical protein n=1 Tax=Thermotalea metallivorans TaxID=520762 RepID=UPI0008398767|nr:hypothetical protein [Thermotalea metallivorans]